MEKFYRIKKSIFFRPKQLIIEGAICKVEQKKKKTYLSYQGAYSNLILNKEEINTISNTSIFELIEKPTEQEITNLLKPDEEFEKVRTIVSEIDRLCSLHLGKKFNTFTTWIYSSIGSSACTSIEEIDFQSNRDKILSGTVLRNGMRAKPGASDKNRSARNTPIHDEVKWMLDDTTLLPNGIKEREFCTLPEMTKIAKKLLQQLVNMKDCPDEIKLHLNTKLGITQTGVLYDYLRIEQPLSFYDFKMNEHHSKTNGLEFCHLDPSIVRTTFADNITIGSSYSNRLQGGYSRKELLSILINSLEPSVRNKPLDEILEMLPW